MSKFEEVHVTGHCYCGAVTFSVDLPAGEKPIFTAYCHCDSCRRSHAAPLYQVACVDKSQFTITAGDDHINLFRKPGGTIVRAFSTCCGTRIMNTFPGWTPTGRTPVVFFPNLLQAGTMDNLPEPLRPKSQSFGDDCVLEIGFLQQLFSDLDQ